MVRAQEVEVFVPFTGGWVPGFEVASRAGDEDGYLVRRRSDGEVLPEPITADRLRPAQGGGLPRLP